MAFETSMPVAIQDLAVDKQLERAIVRHDIEVISAVLEALNVTDVDAKTLFKNLTKQPKTTKKPRAKKTKPTQDLSLAVESTQFMSLVSSLTNDSQLASMPLPMSLPMSLSLASADNVVCPLNESNISMETTDDSKSHEEVSDSGDKKKRVRQIPESSMRCYAAVGVGQKRKQCEVAKCDASNYCKRHLEKRPNGDFVTSSLP